MRPADFAYQGWYPYTKQDCLQHITQFKEQTDPCPEKGYAGIGGIVPHAGWFFSGRLAYHVLSCLTKGKKPDTIIIFGKHTNPSLTQSGRENSIMINGTWETPLGPLSVDSKLGNLIQNESHLSIETEEEYEFDNTIEVQLPFIKYFFPEVQILPIGVVAPSEESFLIGSVAVNAAKSIGREIKLLATTDMTHYGPGYGFSPQGMGEKAVNWVETVNDKKMIDLFLAMDPKRIVREALQNRNCCCSAAVATMITALNALNVSQGLKLEYYTSYSIRPNADFVGYAGVLY